MNADILANVFDTQSTIETSACSSSERFLPTFMMKTLLALCTTLRQHLCAPHEFRTTAFQAVLGHGQDARGTSLVAFLPLCALFAVSALHAQTAWQPSPGHTQIPIWPGAAPDARPTDGPETMERTGTRSLVADKPWIVVENVSRPAMTVYSPRDRNTGAAIVVFPGGGYKILAIDLEGTEVCDWLVAKGITCVLLKYRVPAPRCAPYWGAYPQSPMALEDAQRTISLVRFHAAEWHIDPHKIGVLGFSAGGHLVAATSVHFGKRLYAEIDEADKQSCRPDFAVALYPGHLAVKEGSLRAQSRYRQSPDGAGSADLPASERE